MEVVFASQLSAMELPELLQTAKESTPNTLLVTELICRLEDQTICLENSEKELTDLETKHEAELAEQEEKNEKLEVQLQELEAKHAKAQRLLETYERENDVN